jgi:hypothetical protein
MARALSAIISLDELMMRKHLAEAEARPEAIGDTWEGVYSARPSQRMQW